MSLYVVHTCAHVFMVSVVEGALLLFLVVLVLVLVVAYPYGQSEKQVFVFKPSLLQSTPIVSDM